MKVSLERVEGERLLTDDLSADLSLLNLFLLEALYPLEAGLGGDQDEVVALADEVVPSTLPSDLAQTESLPRVDILGGDHLFMVRVISNRRAVENLLPSSSEESVSVSPTTN